MKDWFTPRRTPTVYTQRRLAEARIGQPKRHARSSLSVHGVRGHIVPGRVSLFLRYRIPGETRVLLSLETTDIVTARKRASELMRARVPKPRRKSSSTNSRAVKSGRTRAVPAARKALICKTIYDQVGVKARAAEARRSAEDARANRQPSEVVDG